MKYEGLFLPPVALQQDVLTRKQKKEQRKSKRGTKTIQSHLKLEAEVEMLTTQAQGEL